MQGERQYLFAESSLNSGPNPPQFFVCGAGKIASGVKEMLVAIIKESHPEVDDARALVMFHEITSGRYATDIFE